MEKVDIATLEALRDNKERELRRLEKEIADARKNDLRIRFNMLEGKYYKIADPTKGTYYFQYTQENIQTEYNMLTVKNSIYKFSSEKFEEIGFKDSTIFDLSPRPTVAINDKGISVSLIPDLFPEKTLKLYGEDSSKIEEADDIEIGKLKVELMEKAERF